jgi:hypothetical protein
MQASKLCCPSDSLPSVNTSYVPRGEFKVHNGQKYYVVGDSPKVILVAYDIFGFEEGSRVK